MTRSSTSAGIPCSPCGWSRGSRPNWASRSPSKQSSTNPPWPGWPNGSRPQCRQHRPIAALTARQRPAVVPLSFAQNRLWFIDQLQGPSPVYNMAVALRLRGRLDTEALGAALADVVGRHESLRTLFPAVEGIARQLVMPPEQAEFGWQIIDATGWPESRLDEAVEETARHTFDLAAEIPLQARLFRVGEDEHVLVGVVHHIAADGLSVAPLIRDLGAAYASRSAGQAPGWAPLAVQYADYTLWQREQLGDIDDSGSPIAAQLAYWERRPGRDARAAGATHRSALSAGG